jgi:hypothetical protein
MLYLAEGAQKVASQKSSMFYLAECDQPIASRAPIISTNSITACVLFFTWLRVLGQWHHKEDYHRRSWTPAGATLQGLQIKVFKFIFLIRNNKKYSYKNYHCKAKSFLCFKILKKKKTDFHF